MSNLSKTWVSRNFHKIKILSLATLLYLTLPLTLLFLLFVQVLRKCATLWAKIKDKKIDKILSSQSSLLAFDDLYGIPSNNVVTWFVLNGNFNGLAVDHLRSVIHENVIGKQTQTSGASGSNYVYSQLQQFPIMFWKFMFWKWDEEFSVTNHIRLQESIIKDEHKIWNEADVIHLQGNLLRKQWLRNKPLWEVLVIPNYKSNSNSSSSPSLRDKELKTVILLRFHESLGDLSSWFRLFLINLCDCGSQQGHIFPNHAHNSLHTTNNVEGIWSRGFNCMMQLSKFPLLLARTILGTDNNGSIGWSVNEKQLTKRDHFKIVDRFSTQHIKDITMMCGVSFTSVILAATTSAIRHALLTLGQSLPKFVSIEVPITVKDQCPCEAEDMLCSFRSSSVCTIQLPVGTFSSRERLKYCHESYIEAKQDKLVQGDFRSVLGQLPVSWYKRFGRYLSPRRAAGRLLNLPGTTKQLSFLDTSIEDVVVASTTTCGFTITFLSYAESVRMSLVMDHTLIPHSREDVANDFLKSFYSELVVLGIEAIV